MIINYHKLGEEELEKIRFFITKFRCFANQLKTRNITVSEYIDWYTDAKGNYIIHPDSMRLHLGYHPLFISIENSKPRARDMLYDIESKLELPDNVISKFNYYFCVRRTDHRCVKHIEIAHPDTPRYVIFSLLGIYFAREFNICSYTEVDLPDYFNKIINQ